MAAIYAADCWCDSCADRIRRELRAAGCAPTNPSDEASYDSDDYPKSMPDDEEADTPQHCGAGENCLEAETLHSGRKVGALFGRLTSEGVSYVREAVREGGEVADLWACYFSDAGYDVGVCLRDDADEVD